MRVGSDFLTLICYTSYFREGIWKGAILGYVTTGISIVSLIIILFPFISNGDVDQREDEGPPRRVVTSRMDGSIQTRNRMMTHRKNIVGKVLYRGAGSNSVEQGVSQFSIRMTAAKWDF